MNIKKIKEDSDKLTEAKARLIAHFIGDGCIFKSKSDYVLKYEVKDLELLKSVEKDLIETYGLKPSWGLNPSGKTGKLIPLVRLRSKLAYLDMLRYATYYSKDWKIKHLLFAANKDIKKEFLKALFDDEGTVIKDQIRLYSINKDGLKQIEKLLRGFRFKKIKITPRYS